MPQKPNKYSTLATTFRALRENKSKALSSQVGKNTLFMNFTELSLSSAAGGFVTTGALEKLEKYDSLLLKIK